MTKYEVIKDSWILGSFYQAKQVVALTASQAIGFIEQKVLKEAEAKVTQAKPKTNK